ncbi:MAG: hypothetical protein ACI9RO_001626 [Alteromonas macleodii]
MLFEGRITSASATDWVLKTNGIPLIYSSSDPTIVATAQDKNGRDISTTAFEKFFADIAVRSELGISKLLTAGGETSGAMVEVLSMSQLEIGSEIDPGVPVLCTRNNLVFALKSGNFGTEDYFDKTAKVLSGSRS